MQCHYWNITGGLQTGGYYLSPGYELKLVFSLVWFTNMYQYKVKTHSEHTTLKATILLFHTRLRLRWSKFQTQAKYKCLKNWILSQSYHSILKGLKKLSSKKHVGHFSTCGYLKIGVQNISLAAYRKEWWVFTLVNLIWSNAV